MSVAYQSGAMSVFVLVSSQGSALLRLLGRQPVGRSDYAAEGQSEYDD